MRLKSLFIVYVLALSLIITACGGASEDVTTSPVVTAPVPGSASPTPTTVGQPAPTQLSSSPLSKAIIPPFELENVRYGGTFRTGGTSIAAHLDPKLNRFLVGSLKYQYEKLFNYEANPNDIYSTFQPLLVEKWQSSADFKTYTIALRKGIKWQNIAPLNGRELVADDIIYNIGRYSEKDSIEFIDYSQIESATATDKYTVELRLKEPNSFALIDLFGQSEYLLPREIVADDSHRIRAVGTGPYILKEFVQRTKATWVRNPDYWRKDSKGNTMPYADEITLTVMGDIATLMAAFRTDQIDLSGTAGQGSGLTHRNAIDLARSLSSVRVFDAGVPARFGIAFATKNKPWDDERVRRAFNMAIDKERYKGLFGEEALPWVYYAGVPWHLISDNPATLDDLGPYYKYNPDESKKLLIQAGFPDGKLKVGTPLRAYAPERSKTAEILQQLLKEHGIEMSIRLQIASDYQAEYNFRNDQDLAISHQNTGDFSLYWYANNKFKCSATENKAWICDPKVEQIVTDLRLTSDAAKIKEYARFLWDFETLGSYVIWVPVQPPYELANARVRNLTIRSGDGFNGNLALPWLANAPRTSP